MAFNWTVVSSYAVKLYDLIRKFESSDLAPKLVDGNITIGMGFDMKRSAPVLRAKVLEAMGVDKSKPADEVYFDRLLIAGNGASISDLNAIMAERAADPAIRALHPNETLRTRFEFLSQDEIKQVFANSLVQASYFNRLLGIYPAAETDAAFKNSSESLALFSIVWNGWAPTEKLRIAIATGNRAEAWYLIRYEVNYLGRKISRDEPLSAKEQEQKDQGIDKGWASRRFSEAQLFGLDAGGTPSPDDARQVYGMFGRHRSEILAYERCYGIDFDGNPGSRRSGGNVPLVLAGAQAIHAALNPAYQTLFADIAARHPDEMSGLSASDFSPVDLFVDTGESGTLPAANLLDATEYSADGSERKARNLIVGDKGLNIILKGGAGDDVIIAGSGNDYLYGGADNDRLYGGAGTDEFSGGDGNDILHGDDGAGGDLLDGGDGFDTYYADDGDTIRDSDGSGEVWCNGKKLTFATRKNGETTYYDKAGDAFTLYGDQLQINDPLTIEGFDNGELGIYLDEEEDPADPPKPPPYNPNDATRFFSSPLALDLNDNGIIDDVSLTNSTVYFDLTDDGIAEKTGWLAPGDGLLGMDFNGNGVIDDRSELFGTTPEFTAFDRMREVVDTNGDEFINANDPLFGALRVWQDANQDGISQTGELKTLDELGITSIDANATRIQETTANGNNLVATAGFTRNGELKTIVDIEFASDTALTNANPNRPLDLPPSLDSAVFQLPWLRGFGVVKSLPLAYQESPALQQAASDLITQGWDGIVANFEGFMAQWTGLAAAHEAKGVTRTGLTIEDKVWMLESLTGTDVRKSAIEAASFGPLSFPGRVGWDQTYITSQWQSFVRREAQTFAVQATGKDWLKGVYYSLNQDRFIPTDAARLQASLLERMNGATNNADAAVAAQVVAQLRWGGIDLDLAALKSGLVDTPYKIVFQVVLGVAPSNGNVMIGNTGADQLSGGASADILDGGAGNDTLHGSAGNDTYIFGSGYGLDTVSDYDWAAGNVDTVRMAEGVTPDDVTLTRDYANLYVSLNNGADRLTLQSWFSEDARKIERLVFANGMVWNAAELSSRVVISPATDGADALFGRDVDDTINGLVGNDQIAGFGGNDTLIGGEGNDSLYGGAGNDTLDGGSGNDGLDGSTGNDTYVFGNSYGLDTVSDYDWAAGNVDTVRMAEGVTPDDVTLTRDYANLYVSLNNGTDLLTLQNWFSGDAYKIERLVFASGTVWNAAELSSRVVVNPATDGADALFGRDVDDTINGLAGNDQIAGLGGDDMLVGGEGSDTLSGDAGNDILDGGAGNDTLDGRVGNDTYLFGRGDGQDTILSYDWGASKQDVVQFKEGVAPMDVLVSRQGNNLILKVAGTQDQLTVQNYFAYDGSFNPYGIEAIRFTDGSPAWGYATVRAKSLVATDGDDTLYGFSSDDAINGLGGNDSILSYGGNDILDGGTGNDTLDGGAGDDIYLFGIGDGQDTISSYDWSPSKQDAVQFKAGVAPTDVSISRDGNNLILKIAGTQDQLTIQNYFWNDGGVRAYGAESIQFADGSPAWDYAAVKAKSLVATDGNDILYGFSSDDVVNGLGGNDSILSNGGNDTLDGGTGNDTLDGGAGDDTYLFGLCDGQDTISSCDGGQNKQDVVQFKEGVAPMDVLVSRQGNNLILKIAGTQDQLTVQNYFAYDGSFNPYGIEAIRFADGSPAWSYADVTVKSLMATEGNDTLYGFNSDDAINGLGGNDSILTYGGNDTLDGGTGNDTLDGGAGNDTYLFGRGDGLDTISSYDWSTSKQDVMQFKEGVAPMDVLVSRQGNNLILKIAGTQDQLTVQNYFAYDGSFNPYGIEAIRFTDGSPAWSYADVTVKSLMATEGNDTLYGFNSDDAINGLGGNDSILTYGGNDTLDGGTGNDTLDGGAGNDTYLFGRGDGQDTISSYDWSLSKQDVVQFKDGVASADVIVSRQADSLILKINGTQDQLTIQGYFYNDGRFNPFGVEAVHFADGSPAWSYADVKAKLPGVTEGDDNLYGYNSDDVIDGLGGNDRISGGGGNDVLNGGADDDLLCGQGGNDTLNGGAGNDTLDGGAGDDLYLFGRGDGQDTISNYDWSLNKQDVVQFKEGVSPDDVLVSRQDDALILKIAGTQDQLTVQYYFAYDGAFNPYGIEAARFSDGSPAWSHADVTAKSLLATIGNDNLYGFNSDDVINGFGGNDMVEGRGGNDTLTGGSGDDRLYGQGGNDTLDGGADNDVLDGGAGDDTYLFGIGDGQDTISSYDQNSNKQDVVLFKEGVVPADVLVSRQGDALILKIAGTQDQLTVQNFFANDGAFSPFGIEAIRFADGSPAWSYADVTAKSLLATEWDDNLYGSNSDDVINGFGGNDMVEGRGGNDTLSGGAGDDRLYGQGGNDTLDGGADNDLLDGGAGDDTYLFETGDGQDTISSYDQNQSKQDVVQFKEGVVPADVLVSRLGDALILKIAGTQDQLTVQNFFANDGAFNPFGIEAIRFTDGSPAWSYAEVKAKLLEATEGDDNLYGYNSEDIIDGLGGNDQISGGGGNDTLTGGSGDDRLYGQDGDDALNGGAGNDSLYSEGGDDALSGGEASDYLVGGDGNDTLDGGSGNDYLNGGIGNDIYLFGPGSGHDYIDDVDTTVGNIDTVQLATGVLPSDVKVTRNQSSLFLTLNDGADRLTLSNWFSGDASKIERVVFGDGTIWGVTELQILVSVVDDGDNYVVGTTGDDTLIGLGGSDLLLGQAGNDTLDGGIGNDYLYGEDGNDMLDGGNGSDYLSGGAGDDTYLFGPGSGQDFIYDVDAVAGNIDTVRLVNAVLPSEVDVTRDQSSLYLNLSGGADRLTLSNWFNGDAYKIERVTFGDGTVWGVTELQALASVVDEGDNNIYGTEGDDTLNGLGGNDWVHGQSGSDSLDGGAGDDTLYGDDGNDALSGGEGNDYLTGDAGNDVLDGGIGSDQLDGGLGNDTYLFGPGSGHDFIYDFDTTVGNIDTVRLADGIQPSEVEVTRDQFSLYLSLNGGVDQLTLSNCFSSDAYIVEQLVFGDGTVWDFATLAAMALPINSEGDDYLLGSDADNALNGLGGNDLILGGNGNDTLDGGSGDDTLDGGFGSDIILFGRGGGHDDIVTYSQSGADPDSAKLDVLKFAAGITPGEVVVSRGLGKYSNELTLSIVGTEDQVRIRDYFNDHIPSDGTGATLVKGSVSGKGGGGATPWHVVDRIQFDDGTWWDTEQLVAMTQNSPPSVANPLADQSASEDVVFSYTVPADTFTDADVGDALTLSATQSDGSALPSWLAFDAANRTFSGTPTSTSAGFWNVRVTASDREGASVNDDFGLDVANHIVGTQGGDNLTGTALRDVIEGFDGNDTLNGGAGDDLLEGDPQGISETVVVNSLVIHARGTAVDNIFPNMEVWIDGVKVQTVTVDATSYAAYVVSVPAGTPAREIGVVFTNDAWRPEIGQDRNLYIDQIVVNGQAIKGNASGVLLDYGSGAGAFDGVNTYAASNGLSTNGAMRFRLVGADLLDGGSGIDTMRGGVGNDVYIVDNLADRIEEGANAGHDLVKSAVSYTLADNVEDLNLTGTANLNGTGNAGQNMLVGNNGANRLDGGQGRDFLVGGLGDDTYVVDHVGDSAWENASAGNDTVESSISWTLQANTENLVLTGAAAINGTGNADANLIRGNSASNTLQGGAGDDLLEGDPQGISETVVVNSLVIHARGTAVDNIFPNMEVWIDGVKVQTVTVDATSYAAYIVSVPAGTPAREIGVVFTNDAWRPEIGQDRNLYIDQIVVNGQAIKGNASGVLLDYGSGAGAFDGVNTYAASNGLSTNGAMRFRLVGADLLDGGSGVDMMRGGVGNDVYIVDNLADRIEEDANAGHDLVKSAVSLALVDNVEDLTLTGTAVIDGLGNALANTLTGNAATNLLNGADGNDSINGAAGLDFLEGMAGNDTLTDTAGNGYFNGGSGADRLTGGVGADFFLGGAGNDNVVTGDGFDVIAFNKGDGFDAVTVGAGSKTVSLGGALAYSDLRMRKSGNDLMLDTGAGEGMAFKNWYAGTTNQNVLNLQVVAEAMSAFDAASADPLLNRRVQDFDFKGLAGAFDTARVANPGLSSWALSNALLNFQLAGSDSAALGGDLAYQYGRNGTLAGIGITPALDTLSSAALGASAQALTPLAGLQTGAQRLS